ncbi:hypothetical protein PRZ48_002681 [Zasmidium cellare]|uniref:Inositolphosphotransferase Aur1/Ipt1 domain-containing protein n=1 Tax=Zasmidium cellare TaxID=395010 RepID=A0ABR0ETJ1_ZASCE|nr:hypothetical protein PRZ48_002681 [Zasmidium cellare]
MGAGAFIEPLVVISLLIGGTLINRNNKKEKVLNTPIWANHKRDDSRESGPPSPSSEDELLSPRTSSTSYLGGEEPSRWRTRRLALLGLQTSLTTPNTAQYSNRILSRVLHAFPFLVEVWYWALIYWVYQLGRAFTAVTLVQGTVHTARKHALQLIHLEQRLGIFWEPAIQRYFLQFPTTMHWINRIYSFIHIPGTILFLIWLYYLTITANKSPRRGEIERSPAGPALYQARRRTMAMCNLIAFVVFTAWPCMPPRLLSDPEYFGGDAVEAKSYGFVDTVHGADGESSVWTQNKFCNQFAAMPSLHFGYSLLIGLTIASIPLASSQEQTRSIRIWRLKAAGLSAKRVLCIVLGFGYPATILLAIIATANHFILDAVAGALVCGIAWNAEKFLLNLLPLEDWFLWCLRMHKPEINAEIMPEWDEKAGRTNSLPR